MELPPAALLFRSARQYVYGVLFSLAETQRKMERLAIRRRLPMEGKYYSSYSNHDSFLHLAQDMCAHMCTCAHTHTDIHTLKACASIPYFGL
jgi:hypothetical protein